MTSSLPLRLFAVLLMSQLQFDQVASAESVFTLQMNDLYNIEFSIEMLTHFYTCLCDYQDQSCTVLLERDLAFTYITRLISVSRFPSFANRTHQQVYSKNFVCTIPTSFNNDQMIGCIRLKKSENLCDNLELCESVNMVHGDACQVGFAGVYWLYPGRIRQKIDNRYVSFSQCSQECSNTSTLTKSVINSNPVTSRTTTKTPLTTVLSTSTTSGRSVYNSVNARVTSPVMYIAHTSSRAHAGTNLPFFSSDRDGKTILMIFIIIGIVLVILAFITVTIIVCRNRKNNRRKIKSSSQTVIADPNSTLQYKLRHREQDRAVLNSLSEADSSSLSEFTTDTPSTSSSHERLIAKRKAANNARENLGRANGAFHFDVCDNTFSSFPRHGRSRKVLKTEDGVVNSNTITTVSQSVTSTLGVETSSLFENSFTVTSNPRDGSVYAKVDSSHSDIFYDDYDFSNQLGAEFLRDIDEHAHKQNIRERQLPPTSPALYATVGDKTNKPANAYSRLNETVRIVTNPYNKLSNQRDETDATKKRLKPYSITRLYPQNSVSIVGDEFYGIEFPETELHPDDVLRSGYVNFKYGTLLEEIPASLATGVSTFHIRDNSSSTSLPAQKHIYFELEKESDISSQSTLSKENEKMC